MRYVSLFAGIGGFDLALNRLGHVCVWANEWDKYAAEIYNKNFRTQQGQDREEVGVSSKGYSGDTKATIGESTGLCDTRDIRTVLTSEIPDHDLLVGGFPCQAFSIAGKRRGFDDTRGTLFFEIARILKDKQPKYFILENVKGLLSHDGGFTFKTIISTLTELGYDLQWQVVNSKNFGVPQNRERVFIVGHLRGQPRPEVFPIGQGSKVYDDQETAKCLTATNYKGIGNDGTTCIKVPTNTKKGYDIAEEKNDGIRLEFPNSKTARGRVVKGASQALKTSGNVGVLENTKIRRLTPTECERLQGFPDGWTAAGINEKGEEVTISDTQRYKVLGNAVTVNVVQAVAERLI